MANKRLPSAHGDYEFLFTSRQRRDNLLAFERKSFTAKMKKQINKRGNDVSQSMFEGMVKIGKYSPRQAELVVAVLKERWKNEELLSQPKVQVELCLPMQIVFVSASHGEAAKEVVQGVELGLIEFGKIFQKQHPWFYNLGGVLFGGGNRWWNYLTGTTPGK